MKISELHATNPGYYNTDKFTGHSYNDFYNDIFIGKERSPINIIEVGVDKGGSIRLLHDYLSKATITGFDINQDSAKTIQGLSVRARIVIGNAYVVEIANNESIDLIIDDGDHSMRSQIYALENFPKYLKSGGLLVIEDVPKLTEEEIIKHAPSCGSVRVLNLRHIKNRWDDCLIIFKKN